MAQKVREPLPIFHVPQNSSENYLQLCPLVYDSAPYSAIGIVELRMIHPVISNASMPRLDEIPKFLDVCTH